MVRRLDADRRGKVSVALTTKFASRIIGQPKATEALTTVLDKFSSGLYDRTKPIASMLFMGPTGSGKTATVEAFVEGLYGLSSAMMKVDCAEFQHSHEIAKLLGSPPGYLGHRETHPFFTNASVRALQTPDLPFTVILFDEIEKANDALWNLLLGILDKGQLTTGTNEIVDMRPTIIIMTSNVGSAEMAHQNGEGVLGFNPPESEISAEKMEKTATSAARRKFLPEFLNRLDLTVMFNTLTPSNLNDILKLELLKLQESINLHSHTTFFLDVSPAAKSKLLAEGFDRKYNARNLKRTIDQHISIPLARLISTGQVASMDLLIVDYVDAEWRYFAETPQVNGPSVFSKGRLEVSQLREPERGTPAPRNIPLPTRPPRVDESSDDVLEVPPGNPRPNPFYRPDKGWLK